jgi:DNA replication protein DnaC
MNKKIVNEILEEFAEKRVSARSEAERRKCRIYNTLPELRDLDNEIASSGFKLMRASLDESRDYNEALEEIKQETQRLRLKRRELLFNNGYEEYPYEPAYECDKCDDSGFKNGKMCECLKKAVAVRSYRESGLGSALASQTFENFNLSYYLSGNDPETFNYMQNLYNDAMKYAKNFDGKGNLLMIGGTGLGKTHLSSAIAKVVIENGYFVTYESAQKIFDLFEDKKFGRNTYADTEKFSSSDLLIIDDLGTEHITALSVSILYNLINERCNNSKATIISTNLSPEELRSVYKPRIFSRLLGDFKVMRFRGNDIRMQKLGE